MHADVVNEDGGNFHGKFHIQSCEWMTWNTGKYSGKVLVVIEDKSQIA